MDPQEEASATKNKTQKEGGSSRSSSSGRRIVKATPKVSMTTTTTTTTAAAATTMATAIATTTTTLENEKEDRIHGLPKTAQSDQELLEESLDKDKQSRLTKLQHEQKNKRNKAVDERRRGGDSSGPTGSGTGTSTGTGDSRRRSGGLVAVANPFSRFLSVFSVEPKFPLHKRRYEPSNSELQDPVGDLEPKRAKIDPDADDSDEDDNDDSHHSRSSSFTAATTAAFSILQDWCQLHLPVGWPWMAVVAATGLLTVVVMVSSSSSASSSSRSHHNNPAAANKRLP